MLNQALRELASVRRPLGRRFSSADDGDTAPLEQRGVASDEITIALPSVQIGEEGHLALVEDKPASPFKQLRNPAISPVLGR